MSKLKNLAYTAAATAMAITPLAAGAQWGRGLNNAEQSGLPGTSITQLIATLMNWLLAILGFIAIIAFVIAGILYLTAAGNQGQIDKAKSTMIAAITGVIVALLGFIVVRAVTQFLTGNSQF